MSGTACRLWPSLDYRYLTSLPKVSNTQYYLPSYTLPPLAFSALQVTNTLLWETGFIVGIIRCLHTKRFYNVTNLCMHGMVYTCMFHLSLSPSSLHLPVCLAVGEGAEEKTRQWECSRDVLQNSESTCNSSQSCFATSVLLITLAQTNLPTLLLHHMLLLKLQNLKITVSHQHM